MALQLTYAPGFCDVPDAQLAAGAPASAPALSAVKGNADFGPVAYEQFLVHCVDGDQIGGNIPLPFSQVDNYPFSQDECFYTWEVQGTTNRTNGLPSAPGGLLGGTWNVDQATGKVSCFEVYQVEGGQSQDTTDGVLAVTIHAIRGRQIRTIAAGTPTHTPGLSESTFTQDMAVQGATMLDLSLNAKCASISVEPFIMNPSNAPVWAPSTNYSAGDLVQPTAKYMNGCWYVAANAGLSGTIEPGPWPSDPGYQGGIVDGGVIWNLAGYGFLNGQQIPFPKSDVDGYQYSAADSIVAIPFHASTFSLPRQTGITISSTSGEGNVRSIAKSIVLTAPTAAAAALIGQIAPIKRTAALNTAKTIYPGMSSPPNAMKLMTANPTGSTTGVGILNCFVEYENGNFDDGTCHILLICTRAFVANVVSGNGATFTEFATTDMLSGNPLQNTELNDAVRNANFGILRPEIFSNTFTEAQVKAGATVPVPTSATGYVYSRAELQYLWYWTTTGASGGRLRDFDVGVNPQTGVVETRTDYFTGAYKAGYGNIATAIYGFPGSPVRSQMPDTTSGVPGVVVTTLARRSHETILQSSLLLSTPGTSTPAPPSQNNLLPNPDFQLWSRMQLQAVALAGVADDWYMGEASGTYAFLQETGIIPGSIFAQGIGAQCSGDNLAQRASGTQPAGSPAQASILSDIVSIAPGGLYSCGFIGKASPDVINYGLYLRVHLLDINGQNDTYFSLLGNVTAADGTGLSDNPGSPLNTSAQSFSLLFTLPTNGATTVVTTGGNAVLSQTLTFIPAYAYVEILLWSPTYTGYGSGSLVLFAILNKAFLEYLASASSYLSPTGIPATIPAWSNTVAYTVGQAVTWEGGLYVCIVATTAGTPPSNATYWQAIGTTTWTGPYNSANAYTAGQEVSYSGSAWICILNAPAGNAPALGSSYWDQIGVPADYQGAWSVTQAYTPGQEVSANDQYGNPQVWICLQNSTGNTPSSSPAYWSLISNISYQGVWASGTSYQPANQVQYQGNVFLALKAVTAGIVPGAAGSAAYWLQMGSTAAVILSVTASSPISQWLPTVLYYAGSEAEFNGNYYHALQDNTAAEPDLNLGTDWVEIGTSTTTQTPLGPWNIGLTYNLGDEVTYAPTQSASSTSGSASVSPGSVASVSRGVSGVSNNVWQNPSNALGTSSYATCTLFGSNPPPIVNESEVLQFTNFNFSAIPAGSKITGIAASVKRFETAASGESAVYDDLVTLLGVTGTVKNHVKGYAAGNAWPTSAAVITYGGDIDLWGVTPTLAQVQANTFGFAIACQCTLTPGTGGVINLNSATMTVYYVTPNSGQGTANVYQSLAGGNTGHEPDTNPNWWALKGPASTDGVADGTVTMRTSAAVIRAGASSTGAGNTMARSYISAVLQLNPTHFWQLSVLAATSLPGGGLTASMSSDFGSHPITLLAHYSGNSGLAGWVGLASANVTNYSLVPGDSDVGTAIGGGSPAAITCAFTGGASTTWSAAFWMFLNPAGNPSGILPILSRANAIPPTTPTNWEPHIFVDSAGYLYVAVLTNAAQIFKSASPIGWSVPHHIAVVVNSTAKTVAMYRDGYSIGGGALNTAEAPGAVNTWVIGALYGNNWPSPLGASGWIYPPNWLLMEDLAIWEGGALANAQVSTLFNAAAMGANDIDSLNEGAIFNRVLATAVTSGQPDLSKSGIINKHLGYIADDPNSGRFANANNAAAAQPQEPYNGGFEISNSIDGTTGTPPGWQQNYEATGSGYSCWITRSVVHGGSAALAISNGSGGMTAASQAIPVLGNARYTVSCWAASQVANPGTMYLRINWYKDTGNLAFGSGSAASPASTTIVHAAGPATAWPTGGFTQFSGQAVAPSNAVAARIEIGVWTGTSGWIVFDDVHFQPSQLNLADGVIANMTADFVGQGSTYMIPTAARINAATDTSGNLLLKNIAQGNGSSTNGSTTSNTPVAIDTVNVSQTITPKGNKVLVILGGSFWIETGSGTGSVMIYRDGAQIGIPGEVGVTLPHFGSLTFIDEPTANVAHTYRGYWQTTGGTLRGDYINIHAIELG